MKNYYSKIRELKNCNFILCFWTLFTLILCRCVIYVTETVTHTYTWFTRRHSVNVFRTDVNFLRSHFRASPLERNSHLCFLPWKQQIKSKLFYTRQVHAFDIEIFCTEAENLRINGIYSSSLIVMDTFLGSRIQSLLTNMPFTSWIFCKTDTI